MVSHAFVFNKNGIEKQPLNDQIAEWLKNPNITNLHHFISPAPVDIGQQPSVRHCHVIKYALENYGINHNDIVVIVDGDAFPIRPISVRSLLSDYHFAGLLKLEYLWVVFVAFDPRNVPNIQDLKFDIAVIDNVIHDTGSHTYHYLRNNPNAIVRTDLGIDSTFLATKEISTLLEDGFTYPEIDLIKKNVWPPVIFNWDNHFLHFFSVSFDFHGKHKEESVKEFVDAILQN